MKKQWLYLLLCGSICFSVFDGTAQSVALGQDFEGNIFPPEDWEVADIDNDGRTWIGYSGPGVNQKGSSKKLAVSFTRNPDTYSPYGEQDNWLITPAFTVGNTSYVLSFDYAAQDTENTESIQILVSEGGTGTADFSNLWSTIADNGYNDDIVINTKEIPLKDYEGKTIRIAFRHNNSGTYGLSVDNVFVFNMLGPGKPKWYGITPGENGAKSATLKWLNPETTANGNTLKGLSIVIYRDGQPIKTLDNQEPGSDGIWTDTNVATGTHSYSIAAKNEEGEGVKITPKQIYIGEDVPAAVRTPFASASGSDVVLTWSAPTSGANKGYVDFDNLTYVITRTIGEQTQSIQEVTGSTTYTDKDAPKGVELIYTIQAKNEAGISPVDDYTSAFLATTGYTDIEVARTSVRDNTLARLPMDVNSNYSVTQTIYYPTDLKFARGTISSLIYKSYKGTSSALSFPARIYLTETSQTMFDKEWVGMQDAVKVFEGQITMSQGARDVEVKLTTPFEYNGGNLCVTVIKDGKNNGAYSDRFYSIGGMENSRSFTTSTSDPVDVDAMPHSSYGDKAIGEIPYTRFIIHLAHTGSISGTVTDSATGQPLEGATVNVAGFDGMTVSTDSSGQFTISIVPEGNHTVNVTYTGYEPATMTADVAADTDSRLDFTLAQRANYELKGKVLAGDTGISASGAIVSVSGYGEASCKADESGCWSLPGIYAGEDYTLRISYPLYDTYITQINNDSQTSIDAGTIMLERSLIPAYGVEAQANEDGTCVNISWCNPLSRTGEAGWKSIGDVATQSSTSGDYYATDYNVAHAFAPEDIAGQQMEGMSITGMKIYIAASQGVFTATVWEGTRDDNVVLAEKTIPAEMITATGGWVTVTFDEPVEIKKDRHYMVGANCLNPSSSPIGTPGYGSCVTGKNCLKWSSSEAVYDGYYGWCIMALCGIPGSTSGIADNDDAPACSYNVYRGNLSGEIPTWEKVTTSAVSDLSFTDAGWNTIMSGDYRYAVTAVYQNGESMKALSDLLPRSHDYDASVSAFISPVKSIEQQNEAEVKVTVANYGEKTISDFPVELSIDGQPHEASIVTGSLNKGESTEINFGKVKLGEGMHTFVATAKLADDEQPANDACTFILPNLINVELTGYRWNAYGDAGFMRVQSNNPEAARYLTEVTPDDALIIAGEYVNDRIFAYTATWYGTPKSFVELDPETWIVTHSVENTDSYLLDMAYDYAGKTMYGLMPDGNDVKLVTIDLENGSATPVGTLPNIVRTLACNIAGQLYGVADNGDFCAIDKLTASAQTVGPTGVGKVAYLQSMAFDHNTGRLFWAATSESANGEIYEINPANGIATKLGNALFKGTDPSELVCLFTPYEHKSSGEDYEMVTTGLHINVISDRLFRISSPATAHVRIYDMTGSCVWESDIAAGTTDIDITQPCGIYLIHATCPDGTGLNQKIVIR